jgi:MFS family permease
MQSTSHPQGLEIFMSTVRSPQSLALPDPRRWLALALLAVADFVVILDGTIVNVALPSIGTHLHASTSSLSWVISAYVLAFRWAAVARRAAG